MAFHLNGYSNFHDDNQDWIVSKIKNIDDAEANTAESAEEAAASAEAAQNSAEAAVNAADSAANDAAKLALKAEQVDLNTERIDNILVEGTPTEGNAELIDIRVGANGVTYPTAGDAVRGQVGDLDRITDFLNVKKTLYKSTGNGSDYGASIDNLIYAYMLNDGGEPIVIPKGSKIFKMRFPTPSAVNHAVNIYFLKRGLNGYVLISKLENVDITGGKWIDLYSMSIDQNTYIAVANYDLYAVRFAEALPPGATNNRNMVAPIADIGTNLVTNFTLTDTPRWIACDIEILTDEKTVPIYTVGAGKDFTYFTAMLRALKNNTSEKIVYVYGGDYNIYDEKGGANFVSSITNPESVNWRDVSEIVPENTHIIGIGRVRLTWLPPASVIGSNAKAALFAPLNLTGSATIENIEIVAQNCRYGIHDETSNLAQYTNVQREYKNVTVLKNKGDYGYDQVYGAGLAPSGHYVFKNCMFRGDRDWMFSMHTNNMNATDKLVIDIDDCIFIHSLTPDSTTTEPVMGFGSTSSEQNYADVNINNSWIRGSVGTYPEGGAENITNAFQLKLIGCNNVGLYNSTAVNNRTPIKLNTIG